MQTTSRRILRIRLPQLVGVHQLGFTLIEIMAVILIMGLAMSLLLPAIGAGGGARLRGQAERVGAVLELARQRAVVTGKPHRVLIDLESATYGIEWFVADVADTGPLAAASQHDPLAALAGEVVDLAPPREETAYYQPIPNRFGGSDRLDSGYFFEGVDTPEGWIKRGEVAVVFDWDGSSDAAQIVISDPDSRSIDLDIAPLLEVVRIREEND
jgi:prepilin-type N-terminal cleavage/methylation domain-containing protein